MADADQHAELVRVANRLEPLLDGLDLGDRLLALSLEASRFLSLGLGVSGPSAASYGSPSPSGGGDGGQEPDHGSRVQG
ncbi:MAG: hypothetical protein LC792_16980 [Actinobacteria bacterium]|nr:hypothetical protein [Actinomycetota bacterium]